MSLSLQDWIIYSPSGAVRVRIPSHLGAGGFCPAKRPPLIKTRYLRQKSLRLSNKVRVKRYAHNPSTDPGPFLSFDELCVFVIV
jgi:hypothetical protein